MKAKFLKISKPCSENWDNMTTSKSGNYCDVCAKTVVDFSKLSQLEISKQMQKINGTVCARISQSQLDMPLINFDSSSEYKIPYSNVAASLMLATTMLAAGQPMQSENKVVLTEISQSQKRGTGEKIQEKQKPNLSKPENFTIFKGIVQEDSNTPILNAQITLVTASRQFSAYSLDDGTFSIKIPNDFIDDDNVIRVTYNKIQGYNSEDTPRYGSYDYVLSRDEMSSTYLITAQFLIYVTGKTRIASTQNFDRPIPLVLSQGREINFQEFAKALQGQKSTCSLENKEYSYFDSKAAIAIYGQKAKWGLYILSDKK